MIIPRKCFLYAYELQKLEIAVKLLTYLPVPKHMFICYAIKFYLQVRSICRSYHPF